MSDKAERLYEEARALPPETRAEFIREACRRDLALRDELLSLLEQADDAEQFFGRLGDAVLSSSFYRGALEDSQDSTSPGAAGGTPTSSSSRDLPVGHEVGHYRILEGIGRGGMGTVYRARDTRLGRDVALKFLPPYLSTDDEAQERLLIEARAAAALQHPNVCTIHEIGETDDGRSFIAMAFYEGETLKDRVSRGPLAPEDAIQVASQIADALAAAHGSGIVHRDVKPGNVMLTAEGTVKLLDFGLAKLTDVTVTRPGETPGTVAYMSPEQVRGEPLDPRTDLWSLGVVLYEMLTGVRPFRGGHDRVLLQAILHEDPEPVARRRPDTPEPLALIAEGLLQKQSDARYTSAEELRADLDQAMRSGDGVSRLSRPGRRRRWLTAIAIAAVLAALVTGPLWFSARKEESAPAVAEVVTEQPSIAVLPLTDLGPDGRDAALADGVTEELIGILTRTGLRVIASTSVFALEGSQLDVRQIGDSLGVSYLLEGNLQKIGDRLRVQVQLVDARDGSTRWSETYFREFTDVFAVQSQIARAVARELGLRLAGDSGANLLRHETPNIAAYELYVRGSDQTLLRSDSGFRRALEYFEQAIAVDSTYAAAYAGLARMRLLVGDPRDPDDEMQVLAERAARKAIALDDSLGEAHAALGIVRWRTAYDFAAAETELTRAIDLDPSRALFRQWLAQLYIQTGRPQDALPPARRAVEIDPLSPSAHAELAHALLLNGRYDEALARLQRIAAVQPPLRRAAPYTAQAYAMKGMWSEAIETLRPHTEDGDSRTLSIYGYLLARAGRHDEAARIRETLLERWPRGESGAFDIAVIHAGLDDFDGAFEWLDRSIDDRSLFGHSFNVMDPIFEELHSDPRFERIRERLGLQKR